MVEPRDPFESRQFDRLLGLPGCPSTDQLGLVQPVDRLGQGVVGCHAPGDSPAQGAGYKGIHILAPESRTATHYHVGIVRRPGREEDHDVDAEITRIRAYAFQNQDAPQLEAMQEMLSVDELLKRAPVLSSVDQGPVRIKRVLEELRAGAGEVAHV